QTRSAGIYHPLCEIAHPPKPGSVRMTRATIHRRRTMRRFIALVATEIDFVSGDNEPDGVAQSYEKHLAEMLQEAANKLSLRTIKGNKVVKVQVAEIKGQISL